MADKKTTTKTTVKTTKTVKQKTEVILDAYNSGFKAGDVYQALAATKTPLGLKEISKAAQISIEDALLGIGWLFKEGKIKSENNLLSLL